MSLKNLSRNLFVITIVVTASLVAAFGRQNSSDMKPFLGRWDLTLKAGDKEYPSWLELSEKDGKLMAVMTGRWGNARPLPKADVANGELTFVSPKEEEDSKTDLVFQGKLEGDTLVGTVNAPEASTWSKAPENVQWTWTGKRAPSLKRTKAPQWGKPIQLFDGKDLSGWHMMPPNSDKPWKVVDGVLVSPGRGPELISDQKFNDFKLHIEFNIVGPKSNSGVYLRGRYEVQVETDSIQEPPTHHTGAVYGFIAPQPEQPRTPDVWQTYDITLVGRTVTVVQNGHTVIDHKEIPGITGGALDSHEGEPGPIYLQGSEDGQVKYRNIVITPAKD